MNLMILYSCLSDCSLKCHVKNQQYTVQEIWITNISDVIFVTIDVQKK